MEDHKRQVTRPRDFASGGEGGPQAGFLILSSPRNSLGKMEDLGHKQMKGLLEELV